MKRKILVKEKDGDDKIISILETEEEPDSFLRKNGYTDFSWSYINFGQRIRISNDKVLHR